MSDLIKAAESINKLARQYEHMVTAADALKRVGSLEQAEKEVEGRLEALRAEMKKESARVMEQKAMLDTEEQKYMAARQAMTRDAQECRAKAEADSLVIMEAAEAQVAKLKAEAAQMVKVAHEDMGRLQDELRDKAAASEARVASMDKMLSEKTAELNGLNAKIEKAKEAVRRVMGE